MDTYPVFNLKPVLSVSVYMQQCSVPSTPTGPRTELTSRKRMTFGTIYSAFLHLSTYDHMTLKIGSPDQLVVEVGLTG
jgi:hypothetical protein